VKKQRKQPNRAHVRTKPTVGEAVRPLRVSIITSPKSHPNGPVLHRDVELVKAALLYADEVELVSPGAAMLGLVAGLAEGGIPALIELFGSFDDETLGDLNQGKPMPDNFREMLPLLPLLMDPGRRETHGDRGRRQRILVRAGGSASPARRGRREPHLGPGSGRTDPRLGVGVSKPRHGRRRRHLQCHGALRHCAQKGRAQHPLIC